MLDYGYREQEKFLREYQARKELSVDACEILCGLTLAAFLVACYFVG